MKTTAARGAWLDYWCLVLFGVFVVSAFAASVPYAVARVPGPVALLVSALAAGVALISMCAAVVTG
jgi:hypothetical protein